MSKIRGSGSLYRVGDEIRKTFSGVVSMKDFLFIALWFFSITYCVNQTATRDSLIAIPVPYAIQRILLIFADTMPRIGLLTVVSQIYNFLLLLVFIWSRIQPLTFLYAVFDDPNTAYRYALLAPIFVLLPLTWIEIGVCHLIRNKPQRRSEARISPAASGGNDAEHFLSAIMGTVLNSNDAKSLLQGIRQNDEIDWEGVGRQCGFPRLSRRLSLHKNRGASALYGEMREDPGVFLVQIAYQTDEEASATLRRMIWSDRAKQPLLATARGRVLNLLYQAHTGDTAS